MWCWKADQPCGCSAHEMSSYPTVGVALVGGRVVAHVGREPTEGSRVQAGKLPTRDVEPSPDYPMQLGAFSVSLAVKDLQASTDFYKKFGFTVFGGNSQNWTILKNGHHIIGLFQGMFDKNILTFNPGWDQNAQNIDAFTDVRDLQKQLKADGVVFVNEADEATTGPASFMVADPDGNTILFDQHR